MPYMWPIKTCLWLGIVFLLVQGISELLKSYWAATKGKWPGGGRVMLAELIDPAILGFILIGVMLILYFCRIPNIIYINIS